MEVFLDSLIVIMLSIDNQFETLAHYKLHNPFKTFYTKQISQT